MNKLNKRIKSAAPRRRDTNNKITLNNLENFEYSLCYLFGNSVLGIPDYVPGKPKKVSASLQTYAWNRFTTHIKRSTYRRHVVRYKFSLSRVLSNELVVVAKLRRKLRFVAGGERLNSQILPRDFPLVRGVLEKKGESLAWKVGSICVRYFSLFFTSKI